MPVQFIITLTHDSTAPIGRQWLAEMGGGNAILASTGYTPAQALRSLAVAMEGDPLTVQAIAKLSENR